MINKTHYGPDGKAIFGMVKMGEKGQIVIPKEAREMFDLKPGDYILLIGDINQGLAIPKKELVREFSHVLFGNEVKEKNECN